jgi:hypothetical protein
MPLIPQNPTLNLAVTRNSALEVASREVLLPLVQVLYRARKHLARSPRVGHLLLTRALIAPTAWRLVHGIPYVVDSFPLMSGVFKLPNKSNDRLKVIHPRRLVT